MTKCDFCTESNDKGKCFWDTQTARRNHCREAIETMERALRRRKGETMERLTYRDKGCTQLRHMHWNENCTETCYRCATCDDCPIREAFEKLAMYEDLDEKGLVISEATQEEYDKIMKISWYLTREHADELWKDFGMERTGDVDKDLRSIMQMLDKLYEREKKKYPAMWYEYAVCSVGDGAADTCQPDEGHEEDGEGGIRCS